MEEQKLITFIDATGRTIIATTNSEDENSITVKNPAILFVQPTQDGKLNVQTIPLYFREFISDKNRNNGTLWRFNKANITVGIDVDNDVRLVTQYNTLFAAQSAPAAPTGDAKIIKLFDE